MGDDEMEGVAISSEPAVLGCVLGADVLIVFVEFLFARLFGALLGGVPMRGSTLNTVGEGVVLIVELDRLVGDGGGTGLERDTDRLLRRSARDDIAVLLLVSIETDGCVGTEGVTSFLCSSGCCAIQ